jgi:outer membrane protein TolC
MKLRKIYLFLLISGTSFECFPQTRDLNFFLSEGLKNSPLITDLKNQVRSVSLDSLSTAAQLKPRVEGRSQLLYSPYGKNWGYDEVITDGGNYQAAAYVSQDLFMKSKSAIKYRTLDFEKQNLALSVRMTSAELKKTITGLYIDAFSSWTDLSFNLSLLALMRNQDSIARKFAGAGIYSRSDYLSLLVETEGEQVIVSQLRSQYHTDIMMMNAVCGISDTTTVRLNHPLIENSEALPATAYLALRQFTIDSLSLINEKEALNLKYKPSVNWFADAGLLSSRPFNLYRHAGFSAGVALSVPIYDGHQKKIEEDRIMLKEDSRSRYSEASKKLHDQSYMRLKSELSGLDRVTTDLEKQLALSVELMTSLRIQLENGIIKMQDYLSSVKNYRNINRSLILARIDRLRIQNEINYILTR